MRLLVAVNSIGVLTFVCTFHKEFTMDTRIQFRVDEETKRLAQIMAESQGRTLSDACRELTEELAEQQRKIITHDQWLTEEVNAAFSKLESGQSKFVSHEEANLDMEARKMKIRNKAKK
jgi:antitoxin component of RelBE/YafQ-DinJ toxin-antitoxin module|tara:strand:- start:155 stop:511 length:357 start_codon:yes stop_codon:yes gene_type:complete